MDWDLRTRDLEGERRLRGGELVSAAAGAGKLSKMLVVIVAVDSTLGGFDCDLLALVLDRDFLLFTGDVGGLGGGKARLLLLLLLLMLRLLGM